MEYLSKRSKNQLKQNKSSPRQHLIIKNPALKTNSKNMQRIRQRIRTRIPINTKPIQIQKPHNLQPHNRNRNFQRKPIQLLQKSVSTFIQQNFKNLKTCKFPFWAVKWRFQHKSKAFWKLFGFDKPKTWLLWKQGNFGKFWN